MRPGLAILLVLLFSIQAGAASPQYTYQQPYPSAPIAYVTKAGRKVYLVPEKYPAEAPPPIKDAWIAPSQAQPYRPQPKTAYSDLMPRRWNIGLELGYHAFDVNNMGLEKAAASYVNILKGLGWSNATASQTLSLSNLFEGIGASYDFDVFTLGAGFRYYNLGTIQIKASSVIGVQNSTIIDAQTMDAQSLFLTAGAVEYFTPRFKGTLNAELGFSMASADEAFTWKTYNGSYNSFYLNSTASGYGTHVGVMGAFDWYIARHFKLGAEAGYKLIRVQNFTYQKIATNMPVTIGPGDKVTDADDKDLAWNLDGFIGGLRFAYVF